MRSVGAESFPWGKALACAPGDGEKTEQPYSGLFRGDLGLVSFPDNTCFSPIPSALGHLSSALPCDRRRRDRDPPCMAQPHRDGQWASSVAGGEFCRLLTTGNQHTAYFAGRDVPGSSVLLQVSAFPSCNYAE